MRHLTKIILFLFFSASSLLQGQALDSTWVTKYPDQAVDSIKFLVGKYRASSPGERAELKSGILSTLEKMEESEIDSIWKAKAFFEGYRIQDKRELSKYKPLVKKIGNYAPRDSVRLKFYSSYMLGNAFIYSETYDSAAYYLNSALDYDEENDLGGYEGAVAERLSIIFYKLSDFERSLDFAKLALVYARPKLKAAVYNQMANTLVMTRNYEEGIIAYDSAATFYKATDNPNWWYPIFNSLTCYLEVKDTARFKSAYEQIKDVPRLKESGLFYHSLDMAKAEFSLTEWQRNKEGSTPFWGGVVLERTKENEKWIRGVLEKQINYTEGEWREHRDALYFLKRWYALCYPDSTKYCYERILELDKSYRNSGRFSSKSTFLDKGQTAELQALVARLGYTMLEEQLDQVSDVKLLLNKQSKQVALFAFLFIISFWGARKTKALWEKSRRLLEELRALNEKNEQILNALMFRTESEGIVRKAKNYEDSIVVIADVKGFAEGLTKGNVEKMLNHLEHCFSILESSFAKYGLVRARTDGSALMAVGGISERNVSPLEALDAAFDGYSKFEDLLKSPDFLDFDLELSISIHVGDLVGGYPEGREIGFDFWGDAIDECRVLEKVCSKGKIAMSAHAYNSAPAGSDWPDHKKYTKENLDWMEF